MDKLKNNLKHKSVAIIGPAPSLEKKKLGKFIDSHDIVIRINEFISEENSIDYGSRTDILFLNLNNHSVEINKKMFYEKKISANNIRLIVCPRNSLHVSPFHEKNFKKEENIFKNFKLIGTNTELFHIGNNKNKYLEDLIGCHPTVGTLALALLNEIETKNIFVAGFSWYKTKFSYNKTLFNFLEPFGFDNKNKLGHKNDIEIKFLRTLFSNNKNISGDAYFNTIILNKVDSTFGIKLFVLYHNLYLKIIKRLNRSKYF